MKIYGFSIYDPENEMDELQTFCFNNKDTAIKTAVSLYNDVIEYYGENELESDVLSPEEAERILSEQDGRIVIQYHFYYVCIKMFTQNITVPTWTITMED